MVTNMVQTNEGRYHLEFAETQLSFSTADIERSVFFGTDFAPHKGDEPFKESTLLVVGGEIFVLRQEEMPGEVVRLTDQSGLFRIGALSEPVTP